MKHFNLSRDVSRKKNTFFFFKYRMSSYKNWFTYNFVLLKLIRVFIYKRVPLWNLLHNVNLKDFKG